MVPEDAREHCKEILGNFAHRYYPRHGIWGSEGMTLGAFVADDYAAWVNASRPRSITVERIESWKSRRLRAGRSASKVYEICSHWHG